MTVTTAIIITGISLLIKGESLLSQKPINLVQPVYADIPAPTATPKPQKELISGKASYYSRSGCLGCSKDFTMANGQKLDDSKITVAYNKGKLNRQITVGNPKTGKFVTATVTDRGGFERHGKIMDLSVATKDALGCQSTCSITVEEQ